MLLIQGAEKRFAGFILLDCAAVQAECIALFSASSAENRLKHLDGFRGAAFFASTCGRFVLEHVLWANCAALAAARGNPTFSEHIRIVEQHATVRYVSFSSHYVASGDGPIIFVRGGRFCVVVYKPRAPKPPPQTLDHLRSTAALSRYESLLQMSEDGASVVLLSGDALDPAATTELDSILGEPDFRNNFVVVESICAPRESEKFPPPYSLALLPAQSRQE